MGNIVLIICIVGAVVYLLCDALQKYAAVQEIARLTFAVALLAFLLGK